MLDHKTWQENPNLIGQISINTEFITMLGFFLKHFGTELMEAQKKATDSNKKLRIIVDYDPEEKKSMISFSFISQPTSDVQASPDSPEPANQCNQQQCQVSKLSDTATLHLYADSEAAQESHQKRIESLVESKDAP